MVIIYFVSGDTFRIEWVADLWEESGILYIVTELYTYRFNMDHIKYIQERNEHDTE